MKARRSIEMWLFLSTLVFLVTFTSGCQFYPYGEYLRFIRVPENTPVGDVILQVEVHPRHNLSIQPLDRIEDATYFAFRDVNSSSIGVILYKSLEDLVDNDNPQNILKFRMVCDFNNGAETLSSYMSVTVYIEDVNDNAPKFLDTPYETTIDESAPVGHTIRGIHAFDRDKPNTPNSDVHYTIISGNEGGHFTLDNSHRATIILNRALDYDGGDKEFLLTVMASDRGSPAKNSTTSVRVTVVDNDDLPPLFTKEVYRVQVEEFHPFTGRRIHQELRFAPPIKAYDADVAINAPIRYDIIAGNERQIFLLDSKNASLFLIKEIDLDREKSLPGNTFVLQIQASQIDNPLKTGFARLEIEILDSNDNLPEFEVDLYNISIVENLPNGFSVLQVIATDKDQGDNGEFSYQLEDSSHAFNIDTRTGWLTVRDQSILDRERQSSLGMKVYAREKIPSVVLDDAKSAMTSSVIVEVTLLDANDNNPNFLPSNLYEFRVPADSETGTVVGMVSATDPDLGRNGMVLYALQRSNTSSSMFSVDPQTGQIRVLERPLTLGKHALLIEASDQPANPSERRFSLAVVTVEVTKPGKHFLAPDFVGAPYEFWVGGDVPIGTSVGQVRVTDGLDRTKIVYDLLHSYHDGVPFAIEERSGVITVLNELKKFERSLYDFEAVVTDERDINLVTNVTVHVVDPQDVTKPLISSNEGGPIEFTVRENLAGAMVGSLLEKSESSNSTGWWNAIRFIIANQQDVVDKFAVSSDGVIYTQRPLDREERDIYRLIIIAENSRGVLKGAGIYQVSIIVEDENDNAPVFERNQYEGHIAENSLENAEVIMDYAVQAKDSDSGYNAQFKFTLYGEGSEIFYLDQSTGKIYVRKGFSPFLDREEKALYNLRIVARDKGNLKSEAKLTIHIDDVNDNSPKFLQMVVLHDQDVEIVESNQDKIKKNTMLITKEQENSGQNGEQRQKIQLPPMISLPENIPVGTLILRLLADDKDSNSSITYAILQELFLPRVLIPVSITPRQKHFMINANNGEVAVAASLSPESEYRLTVSAEDGGGLSDNVTVRIYVKDINDHPPIFSESSYDFELLEGVYHDHKIGKVDTTDADFGLNANVTYSITNPSADVADFPIRIVPSTGEIFVSGDIDRETRPSHIFKITAIDQATDGPKLSSSVNVEVHIIDVNDNYPTFFGYDRLIEMNQGKTGPPAKFLESGNRGVIPVYYTTVNENSAIGTTVARIFANDSDFTGNGNGLILFDINYGRGSMHYFEIDSKEGVVSVMNKLDYETHVSHNVTIVASDLGQPSLTSTALLVVNVLDVPEEKEEIPGPMFTHRYYEVEVEENAAVPLALLQLNVTDNYKGQNIKFSLVPFNDANVFNVDSKNGTLSLLVSPDRETKAKYEVKIRADRVRRGRGMIYPPPQEKLMDVGVNEVKVILRIKDVNDNSPRFMLQGRPIVAAIPTTASYGYQIVQLKAMDYDEGINSEIRYQILGRSDDDSHKFAIDPITGQVRSASSFLRDVGKVYGFDVKATDRKGADNGRSAIANVFVYVLDDQKQVMLTLGSKASVVERNIDAITSILHNATGLDVRVRKIEPHLHSESDDGRSTDVFLYAVDSLTNTIIDMNMLQQVMEHSSRDLKRRLDAFRTVNLSYLDEPPPPRPRAQRNLLSALEVAVVVLGCVVFVGALAAAVCVGCIKKGKRTKTKKADTHFSSSNSGFTLTKGMPKAPHLFPGPAYLDAICPGDTTDTYVEMHSNKSGHCGQKRRHRHDPSCQRHHHHRHRRHSSNADVHFSRSTHMGRLETSLTSLHSSGKDSGITEGRGGLCPCGHSTSHSSGDSSNGSYEDSLKSLHRRNEANLHQMVSARRSRQRQQPIGPPPPPPAPSRAMMTPAMERRY